MEIVLKTIEATARVQNAQTVFAMILMRNILFSRRTIAVLGKL